MKKEIFNNYHKKTRPKPLAKGQREVYRVAGTFNPLTKKGRLKSALRIPPKDTIWDKNKEEYIDIALVDRHSPNGETIFKQVWITSQTNCMIVLTGGKANDAKLYEYFEMCDYNGTKEDRDVSKKILFERVDEGKNAKAYNDIKKETRKAVRIAEDREDEEVKLYFTSKGVAISDDMNVNRMKIEDIAETNPTVFLRGMSTKSDKIKDELKRAADMGVIRFDKVESVGYFADDSKICSVSKGIGSSRYGELLDYLVSDKAGNKAYEEIKAELKR